MVYKSWCSSIPATLLCVQVPHSHTRFWQLHTDRLIDVSSQDWTDSCNSSQKIQYLQGKYIMEYPLCRKYPLEDGFLMDFRELIPVS